MDLLNLVFMFLFIFYSLMFNDFLVLVGIVESLILFDGEID